MLKKFLGIFKRDKSRFTTKELTWQVKYNENMFVIWVIFYIVFYFFILRWLFEVPLSISIIAICLMGVVSFVIAYNQMELKKWLKIESILEKIKARDLSTLKIVDEELNISIFYACIQSRVVKISAEPYGVKILIEGNNETPKENILVNKEEILKYFDLLE